MKYSDINIDDIRFDEYHNNFIKIYYDNSPIQIQLPKLYAPFGISQFGDYNPRMTLDLKVDDWKNDEPNTLYKFIKSLEEKVKDYVINYTDLLSVDSDSDNKFNSNLKHNPAWPPNLRLKLNPNTSFFDKDNEEISDIRPKSFKQCEVTAYIEITGIYFFNNMFGIMWKFLQGKVLEPQINSQVSGFSFLSE